MDQLGIVLLNTNMFKSNFKMKSTKEKSANKMNSDNNRNNCQSDKLDEYIIGTCLYLCPLDEVSFRISEKLTHKLERYQDSAGNYTTRTNRQAVVKQFSRSAAGLRVNPTTVRSLPILFKALRHLLHLCDKTDLPWWEIYEFVHDRIRAIKQDLVVQGLTGKSVIPLLTGIIRFYTFAQYKLCTNQLNEFDPHINLQHLAESLKSLLEIYKELELTQNKENNLFDYEYEDSLEETNEESSTEEEDSDPENDKEGNGKTLNDKLAELTLSDSSKNPTDIAENNVSELNSDASNKEEYKKNSSTPIENINANVDLLDHVELLRLSQQNRQLCDTPEEKEINKEERLTEEDLNWAEIESLNILTHLDDEKTLQHVYNLPQKIRNTDLLKKIIQSAVQLTLGNYVHIVKLFSTLPPLMCCALHRHLPWIQRNALGAMSKAYHSKCLHYSLEDLKTSLAFPSVESAERAAVYYGLSVSEKGVLFDKAAFKWDAELMKPETSELLNEKISQNSLSSMLDPDSV